MKISVVVIGYNIESYIKRCLDSVFSQTYDDYEVIFVNDGSMDRTSEIAKEYFGRQINLIIVDKENGGIISARKAGVEKASGEYICFVDGDDYINPEMLKNFAEAVECETGGYDIILSDYYEERPNGRVLTKKSDSNPGVMEGETFLLGILDGTINHFMFAKMYRKAFLVKGRYSTFPNITIAEDLLTNSVLGLYHPKVLYIDKANYYYQFNETSVTRDGKLGIVDKQIHTFKLMNKKFTLMSGDYYKAYLEFQWYLFASGYLQTNYSNEFKKYLTKKCKVHLYRMRKNPVYRMQKINLSMLYGKTMVFTYLYLPILAVVLNRMIRILINFLHKTGIMNKY